MKSQNISLIKISQLCQKLGVSKSSVYRRINPKDRFYDPSFPKPIKLGELTTRWIESDVEQWILESLSHQAHADPKIA